ncbi:hypothetical protein MKX01_023109 [Papaver californicum]|nr:hypothetical protein MKX01_023109 [Papaver californicum]
MCLAPNLPYMKLLFLGWFEPLRNCIAADQELCRQGTEANYAPYFDQLPAEMMAVVTMHKLMGNFMSSDDHGTAKVVHAACHIGETIEQEVRIHNYLEKTRKKPGELKASEAQIKGQVEDEIKPWGQEAHAKVGSRLIELLIQSAYIQPPVDQLSDGPPDIRPAFQHSMETIKIDSLKLSRKFGVIECDPLILQGLEKTAKHMMIPYMPMLVPPESWITYDKGAHLFLPSYVMSTHGSKQQGLEVKNTPVKQIEQVFEALNILGNTKWRVNKKLLEIVDRVWASGSKYAGLVDRADVVLPEKPGRRMKRNSGTGNGKLEMLRKRTMRDMLTAAIWNSNLL